jgi:hypothetical protein
MIVTGLTTAPLRHFRSGQRIRRVRGTEPNPTHWNIELVDVEPDADSGIERRMDGSD